jgi:tRNA(fMet)-specific endonuclease VapC
MLVLDTDLLTVIQKQSGELYRRLNDRLQHVFETETVAITIISLEEQMRGWLAYLNRTTARPNGKSLVVGYRRLHELFLDFELRTVLDFDEDAYEQYFDLKGSKLRAGTMDLRIAAIVLVHGATLLTRNMRDFEQIPGLKVEDWTKD